MNFRKQFAVPPGTRISLAGHDPAFTAGYKHGDAGDEMADDDERLRKLQYLLYAGNAHSLLIVLQGLDAAGKDGTISHVFRAVNPQGARVHAFKEPSTIEREHDFLWRVHIAAPKRGEIAIYNRSHYEDVLVVRVHGLVPKKVWSNDFEKNLVDANTTILKFFLHMSEKEQLKRFKKRLEDPDRHWKISEADYTERGYFGEYLKAYEDVLAKTSTEHAPWFIIPSDHKWFRNLVVSKIVVETLESLHLGLPPTTVDLKKIRQLYKAAAERVH